MNKERVYFLWLLKNTQYLRKTFQGFFDNDDLDFLLSICRTYYEKFEESPSKEQIVLLVSDIKKIDSEALKNYIQIIDLVFQEELSKYDEEYVEKTIQSWISFKKFDHNLMKTIEYVKKKDINPDNAKTVVDQCLEWLNDSHVNFATNLGVDFFNLDSYNFKKTEKIRSGYNYVDTITTGGYDKKTLTVYLGQQNIGKSIFLCNDAANFVRSGKNTVYLTFEMSAEKILKRVGANLLGVKIHEFEDLARDKQLLKRRLARIGEGLMPPGKFVIQEFPTSQATVNDIKDYLKNLEDTTGTKFEVVVIDYINIIGNYRNPNSENTYLKIKSIAEDLRGLAVSNEYLIITATQINRTGWDSTDVSISNISESAALAHTADMMYAIIQDTAMHLDKEYWLKILKIRDGEGKNSKFKLNIDYNHMRLTETDQIIRE